MDTIHYLQNNDGLSENIFPFMWVHGEEPEVYRTVLRAIYNANLRSVCVEARPHPDYCGSGWWRDMDVILDEARKLGMKIWILDDKKFPTGFAAGKAAEAPAELRRQSILMRELPASRGIHKNVHRLCHPTRSTMQFMTDLLNKNRKHRFADDQILCAVAVCYAEGKIVESVDVSDCVRGMRIDWTPAKPGDWKVQICFATRNAGTHRSYINMMDTASCRIQIDAVYEAHYQHYADDFGKTIMGFFSDEPELGNSTMYNFNVKLGGDFDYCYSYEVDAQLREIWGKDFSTNVMALFSNAYDAGHTAVVRTDYMNAVSRAVEQDFSRQLGDWCRSHGVRYIGHLVEDNNAHTRTGPSLGHYYRGLSGQDMAGIDCIGGQTDYLGEDDTNGGPFAAMLGGKDPEFYHYTQAKLGSSLGELDSRKQGQTMCEIFGNYGWKEGVVKEKYLLDHYLVRGVNRFVPHAFSCKAFPDPDCPPHFYAHGNNPQYRHFGKLMQYANRLTTLFSDGRIVSDIAILYHAEAEWAGGKFMLMQKPARQLSDNQIDFCYLPCDVFTDTQYQTTYEGGFRVNGKQLRLLIVPYMEYMPAILKEKIPVLEQLGCKVVFVDAAPSYVVGEGVCKDAYSVVSLDKLADFARAHDCPVLKPANDRIRVMHYKKDTDLFFIVNEGAESYHGEIELPAAGSCFAYDAMEDKCYPLQTQVHETSVTVQLTLPPIHSLLVVFGQMESFSETPLVQGKKIPLTQWNRSTVQAIDYPQFQPLNGELPKNFSGFVAYEADVEFPAGKAALHITAANEACEVFLNGQSLGIQLVAPFVYDLSNAEGKNTLRIEIASTLERKMAKKVTPQMPIPGITGDVYLMIEEK